MSATVRTAVKLGAFVATLALVLVVVIAAITRPVTGDLHHYTAIFTDANGLRAGDDVRVYGVQVGKVESIDLDHGRARVRLSLRAADPLFDDTTLAIRYQSLTGQRYLDIRQSDHPGGQLADGARIDVDHTVPSFDITTLFNGLKPVLSTFSPGALNQLAESVLAVLDGNGAGIGPALAAIGKLSAYADDRQAVISVLMRNLAQLNDRIGGRSGNVVVLLTQLANVFEALQTKIDGLVDFALTAPAVMAPLDDLLSTLGLTTEPNSDIENLVRTVMPDPQQALDTLSKVPALLKSLDSRIPGGGPGPDLGCSHGRADVPGIVEVLLAGQRVVVCR
ncbi:MlaD family protein [Nocardia nova]|uniref:MlaD family protein n=1 Tax=Nocardia nova TaxID=37330 RepID=UPI00340C4C87